MPNFSGNWKMKSSENFEELLKALGVNMMLRKIAVAAASKPAVEIKQDGESFYIKTSTTVRTTEISFRIGEEFEEQTVDGRPCKSLAKWESENKMVCEQRLLKGEGPRTGWSRELTNDGELILTMTADDVVCTRVYIRSDTTNHHPTTAPFPPPPTPHFSHGPVSPCPPVAASCPPPSL
ncbi:cellular retinoic acid-binding protein 2 [Coturnix japonica]|uniref:Cellular retinoic acid binding protein 2 n=1 Tax=Coturnix japonica TaxID=93934 RepID=A0A8C2TV21_COTJA|nr:cellular retinoic acid-binding protein 2 [Coturnix japonica]